MFVLPFVSSSLPSRKYAGNLVDSLRPRVLFLVSESNDDYRGVLLSLLLVARYFRGVVNFEVSLPAQKRHKVVTTELFFITVLIDKLQFSSIVIGLKTPIFH